MSLSVGIVGLPNVGKSTLFNALLKKQLAYAANFPFATIEPNIGVVPVPDERLGKLAEVVMKSEKMDHLPPQIPATIEFLDIAGLIAGAHKGEGLGNKFLSHIREVNAVCHVVRAFSDEDVLREGSTDSLSDLGVVETELLLADVQTLEKQRDPGATPDKEAKNRWEVVKKLKSSLDQGIPARDVVLSEEEEKFAKELSLLTSKPILVVLNVDDGELSQARSIENDYAAKAGLAQSQVVAISAKIESQIAELSHDEQIEFLSELGVEKSGLERLIRKAFDTLGLINFLTAGEKEVRAWTVKKSIDAKNASGAIHTDFIKKFIKADIVSFSDFVEAGGWKGAREKGRVRIVGKDYEIKDGEVVEFKIGA